MIGRVRHAGAGRCLAVWASMTGASGAVAWWLLAGLPHGASGGSGSRPFDEVLGAGCAAVALLSVGWLWVLVSLVTLDAARGRDRSRGGVPAPVRRAVLAACGLGLVGGLGVPVHASTPPSTSLTGLPVPDRTTTSRGLGHLTT
ncbi:MAG TPA: hypothetical protein VD814_00230, partial [Nocardioides sp.]|nr:hypothetical protein [Nocardioides sp.]